MRLLSVNVGEPREVPWQGRRVRTAIFKEPVTGPVAVLAEHHLAGDGQADLRVHGGPDKAVYAYAHEHYAFWQSQPVTPALLVPGAFGENLTTTGLLESAVRIGDCFQAGTAVLMAVQPRMPCFKLGIRFNDERMVGRFQQARRNGIYFRVVQPGVLEAGDTLALVQASPYQATIQDVVDNYNTPLTDPAKVRELAAIPLLPAFLREGFNRMLAANP